MGILGFYGHWIKSRNFKGLLQPGLPSNVSSLSIDMNSLIHNAAQIVYAYGEGANETRLDLIKKVDPQQLETELFLTIGTKIMEIVGLVRPADTLVLAVDGVAPRAKINQQRQRRYRSSKRPASNIFDTNSVTPGTDFMIRLDNYLQRFIVEKEGSLPIKIIYSSHLVPGEGEHKIFDLMRNGEIIHNGAHVLHGLDADLFMLSMLAPYENIYLIRDKTREVVSVSVLKAGINGDLGTISGYDDFVIMMFFFGNDFIPGQPSLADIHVSIDTMIDIYKKLRLVENFPGLSKGNEINWDGLTMFVAEMVNREPKLMEGIAKKEFKYPSRMLNAATTLVQQAGMPVRKVFNFETFRNAWYTNALAPKGNTKAAAKLIGFQPYTVSQERIVAMILNYLTGLAWNFLYYKQGTFAVNASYLYENFYAPLFTDLALVLNAYRGTYIGPYTAQGENTMFGIPEQLLAVLPPTSQNLLPFELQPLMNNDSIIADMFPTSFIVENDGKNDEHHGIVILPFVEAERLTRVVRAVPFAPERAALYSQGKNIIRIKNKDVFEAMKETAKMQQQIRQTRPGRGGYFRPQQSERVKPPPLPSRGRGIRVPGRRELNPYAEEFVPGKPVLPAWAKSVRF